MEKQMNPNDDARDSIGNADSMVEYEHVDKELPVPLTDRERLEIGEDIAAAQSKAEQAELDKKSADEGYKGIIDGAYADVSQLTKTLRFGKKMTMVQCAIRRDYRLGHIRVIRMDTGEELESRPMTKAERQMGMNFDDGKKAH